MYRYKLLLHKIGPLTTHQSKALFKSTYKTKEGKDKFAGPFFKN